MYLAQLLYKIDVDESSSEQSYELSSLIIDENDKKSAYLIAKNHGNNQNCNFVNNNFHTVHWKFLGVVELIEISSQNPVQQIDSTLVINPSEYKYEKWNSKISNLTTSN